VSKKTGIYFIIPCILIVLSFLPSCSKNTKTKNKSEFDKILKSDSSPFKLPNKGKILKKFPPSQINPNKITITKVDIKPELPFVNSVLTFDIEIKTSVKDIKFYYIYYINNQKVKESYDNTFSDEFKKNDLIYADIIILKDGKEINRIRSNLIKIQNANPIIDNISLPKIKIPGEYKIGITAHDDDSNQEDILKLSLESTGEMPSFTINQEDMIITLNLKKDDFGKTYKFFVKVEDKEGGYSKREIILKLTKKTVKKKKEPEKKKQRKQKKKKNSHQNEGIKIKDFEIGGIGY
jgi:hypothetical protein